jgi:hypothetical protein
MLYVKHVARYYYPLPSTPILFTVKYFLKTCALESRLQLTRSQVTW